MPAAGDHLEGVVKRAEHGAQVFARSLFRSRQIHNEALPSASRCGAGEHRVHILRLIVRDDARQHCRGRCNCTVPNNLADRRGALFPVLPAFGHRNQIFNAHKLYLADKHEDYETAGLWGVRLMFTTETPLAQELSKTMLDDGYYVAFSGVDDYYVKGKSWYREQHFNHDGLIIGYDDDNGTLAIAAYDQRWIFTVFNTPQECFMEGLQALCEKSSYGGIHAVKAKNEAQELNLRAIYEAVKGYLSSDIESYPLTDAGNANGIIVYDYICMYLDKLADGSIPYERRDRRIFRLIWEHKKCMLGRIRAVEEQCKWDASLSADYNEVVALADKIRFIYSKFVIKYSSKDLENIQVCLS